MKRHWNVMKFTCGLLVDSSFFIVRICEQFVDVLKNTTFDVWNEKSYQFLYNYAYLADLVREKSSTSVDPLRNSVICCMNSRYSVFCSKTASASTSMVKTDSNTIEPILWLQFDKLRKVRPNRVQYLLEKREIHHFSCKLHNVQAHRLNSRSIVWS